MDEYLKHVWFTTKKNDFSTMYYLKDSVAAMKAGYFTTEDTGEFFKVTGYRKDLCPLCLTFEKICYKPMDSDKLPVAFVVREKKPEEVEFIPMTEFNV